MGVLGRCNMRVKEYMLVKSPFDAQYLNVPFNDTNNVDLPNALKEYFLSLNESERFIGEASNKFEGGYAFALNYNVQFTTRLDMDENNIPYYNYLILSNKSDIWDSTEQWNLNDYAFYFIVDYKINNVMNNKSVTFELVKDIWTYNYDKIVSYDKVGFINKTHQVSHRIFSGQMVETLSDYRASNKIEKLATQQYYCGIPDRIDVLWLRIKLDPSKKYKLYTESDDGSSTVTVDVNSPQKTYGLLAYFFVPFKAFIKGTPFESDVKTLYFAYNAGNGLKIVTTNMFDIFDGFEYNIGDPYILDIDFTFYPPFQIGKYSGTGTILDGNYGVIDAYVAPGKLLSGDNVIMSKYGYSWIGQASSYTEYEEEINMSDLHIISPNGASIGKLIDEMRPKVIATPQFSDLGDYSTKQSLYNYMSCFQTYPYRYVTIKYPTRANELIPTFFNIDFKIKVSPKDTGTRYAFEFTDGYIKRLRMDLTSEGFEGTGSLPCTVSAFETFRRNSGARYDVDYRNKREIRKDEGVQATANNVLGTVSSVGNLIQNGTDLNVGGIISGIANIGQGVVNSVAEPMKTARDLRMMRDERNAMEADLQSQCSQTANVASNAIVDTIFQDRLFVIYNYVPYTPNIDAHIIGKYYNGDEVELIGYPFAKTRKLYKYLSAKNCDLSPIKNFSEMSIFNNILNGTFLWYLSEIDGTNILDHNSLNMEVIYA